MYQTTDKQREEIEARFSYHKGTPEQGERCQVIRDQAKEFAYSLTQNCPPSRELSQALTALDDATKHAIGAIVRNEKPAATE